MTEQLCPSCGCHIAGDAYGKDGVLYCCQPCAEGSQCECGYCGAVGGEKESKE